MNVYTGSQASYKLFHTEIRQLEFKYLENPTGRVKFQDEV